MNRMLWVMEFILFLAMAPLAFSQDGAPQACPDPAPGTLGCEPVAWSRLQEPVPLPEPDATTVPPSNQQPDPQPGQSPSAQTDPQQSVKIVTGIIVMKGERFVLEAGDDATYQLDNQSEASAYQDRLVKVVGRIDPDSHTLYVESIELTS